MAHKKGGGTTVKNRDSAGKRLGVKVYAGQVAIPGNIIIRQRGTKYFPGNGVRKGSDDTIYALINGKVKFTTTKKVKYDGTRRLVKIVHVVQ